MSGNFADTERLVSLTLGVAESGAVRVVTANESVTEASPSATSRPPTFDVPFQADYADRAGFDPDFLGTGALRVHLPRMGDAVLAAAAPLLKKVGDNTHVLHYHHYSLSMHKQRRLALYTAANVDFGGRWDLSRPTDVWRADPRIATDAQVTDFYYRGNQFDRGHLTRREDLEYGHTRMAALVSAADTCHWTNCTPQHQRFNRSKALWQGIERYILEGSIKADAFRVQVFTGPILAEDDPSWKAFPKIQYPVRFWKLVAAVNAGGKLFATAYILDQSEVIDEYGIEEARTVPFGPFKTFQTMIAEIERETGLTFWSGPQTKPLELSQADPLPTAPRRSRRQASRLESAVSVLANGDRLLASLDSIYLGA